MGDSKSLGSTLQVDIEHLYMSTNQEREIRTQNHVTDVYRRHSCTVYYLQLLFSRHCLGGSVVDGHSVSGQPVLLLKFGIQEIES